MVFLMLEPLLSKVIITCKETRAGLVTEVKLPDVKFAVLRM